MIKCGFLVNLSRYPLSHPPTPALIMLMRAEVWPDKITDAMAGMSSQPKVTHSRSSTTISKEKQTLELQKHIFHNKFLRLPGATSAVLESRFLL